METFRELDRGKGLIVGDDNNCHSGLFAGFLKEGKNLLARNIIKGAGRLITEKEFRILRKSSCNGDSLLLSAGKLDRHGWRPHRYDRFW